MAGAIFTFPGRRRYAAISPRVRMSLVRRRQALASTKQTPADAVTAFGLTASVGSGRTQPSGGTGSADAVGRRPGS